MLSNTCKYAIRAVLYLALNADGINKIGIKKISNDLNIPTPFLGKILQVLAKNKILFSTKGPNGGFSLGKQPKDISLMDIVDIIDGNDNFNSCIIGIHSCTTEEKNCPVHYKYAPIREQAKQLFTHENFEQLIENIKQNQNKVTI
jgi:Rrf2 family transcriptional regulator, iron-sulfur cluster assembly transcription factor